MKREIEFRGINGNCFVYGTYIKGDGEHTKDRIFLLSYNEKTGEEDGICASVEPDTVGQYANFDDINGKRIYEGDIVRINSNLGMDHTGVVVFHKGAFMVKYKFCDFDRLHPLHLESKDEQVVGATLHIDYTFEVIGNIYENPELLKD